MSTEVTHPITGRTYPQVLMALTDEQVAAVAEEIMPGALVAQIASFGEVGKLHQPMSNVDGVSEPACPECFGGIFAVDPEPGRPCGCWGQLQPVCATCAGRYGNGHWYRPKWPCDTWKALVARA